MARSRSPLAWHAVVCPLLSRPARPGCSGAGRGGGGGRLVCRPPQRRGRGAPRRGVALPRSLPLPPLGGHQSGCYWHCSVHGGRGLHTAPIRARVLIPSVVRVAPVCAGTIPPACRGLCGSRQVGAWGRRAYWLRGVPPRAPRPSLGEGGLPPCPGGGRGPAPPWPVSGIPRAGGGWGGGRGRGGSRRGPSQPSSGGVDCGPRPWPPFMAGGVAPRIPPCCMLGWGCLAAPGAERGLAGRWWVSLAGGGVGRCDAPPRGLGRGAPRGGGREGCSAAVRLSALPGWAPRRVTLSLPRPPNCTGSHLRATVLVLPTGCPCGPAQGCRPAAGTAGVGSRRTGSVYGGSGAPTWVSRPSRGRGGGSPAGTGGGGAGSPSPWPALGCPWVRGEEGEGGEGGELPAVAPWSPGAAPRWLREGGLVAPAPGGPAVDGGGALPSCSPPPSGR